MVHVEEIDWRAIAIITIACPNLIKLGLQNCEFMDEDEGEERSADVDPFRYGAKFEFTYILTFHNLSPQ